MSNVGKEEVEYESDPEEEKRLLGMRRREAASDDEEGDDEGEEKRRVDRSAPIHSDDESDGQGGAAEYDDEGEEEEEGLDEEEEEVYEDVEDEEGYEGEEGADEYEEGMAEGSGQGVTGGVRGKEEGVEGRKVEEIAEAREVGNHVEDGRDEEEDVDGDGEAGKKENEPFAVPTAGAFYMHDDRFSDNVAGGRNRRTYGGRKLWESKDDKKWGHDKFEEMTSQDRHYEQGRRASKGAYRTGGGKNRGPDRGYNRRGRPKPFSNGNNQNEAPKGVKGRGPRKYEHMMKNISQAPPMQQRQPVKASEKMSHASGKVAPPALNKEPDPAPPARTNSSLNSASPPFYPFGSSNKDITMSQKRDAQAGNRNLPTTIVDESFSMQQSNALTRGKNIAESVGIDKLYSNDTTAAVNPLSNTKMPPAASSVVNAMQSSQSRGQGRGVAISGSMTRQSISPGNKVNRVSASVQLQGVQRNPAPSRIQPAVQAPSQQLGQRSVGGSRASPSKTGPSISSYEPGDAETNSESGKSRTALVAKGNGSIQGSGRGSFIYGGGQVVEAGNMGVGHGDQNFPTFLPVMQFGGQHPGGIGVPAVGMAFPGYVAQSQLGVGNSEMTWLPVLTGAAGALGAAYCSPYLAVDGAYHGRPSGQTSSASSSSKESTINKTNNDWKPSQRPQLGNDDLGQRQKPRRYSEMDFKQPSTST